MKKKTYKFKAKLWKYEGKAAWYFVSLPKALSKEIKLKHGKNSAAWGSIKVEVTIGKTKWETSIFSDSKRASYLLPIKVEVRKKEKLFENDNLQIMLTIKDVAFDIFEL